MLEYICTVYAAGFFLDTQTLYKPIWTANLTSLTYGHCRTVKNVNILRIMEIGLFISTVIFV